MLLSNEGLLFIARREALVLVPYQDGPFLSIGFGHNGANVTPDLKITPKVAFALLRSDVMVREATVERLLKVKVEQHVYDMLVSMFYQSGNRYVHKIIARLNAGLLITNKKIEELWLAGDKNLAGVQKEGLTKRRRLEYEVCKTGKYDVVDPATGVLETTNPVPFFPVYPGKMQWYTVTTEDLI